MATKKKPSAPSAPSLAPEARSLLDRVLAAPADVEARLVFADWLTEHGDPRGEFIQLQCSLNRPLVDASGRAWKRPLFDGDPAELEKRERKLLSLHQKEWVAPFRHVVRTWNWSRGFVESVVADTQAYVDGAAVLFSWTPVVEVKLTAMKKSMLHALAGEPTTARLRLLDVSFQKLDAAALSEFSAPTFAGLQSLNLAGNRFGQPGADVLSTIVLPSLEALTLNDAKLTDDVFETLVSAPFFKHLRRLELGWNPLSSRIAALLCTHAPQLTWLSTASIELDAVALRALKALPLQSIRVRHGMLERAQGVFGPGVKVFS